jgi:hypothetical protein
VESPAAGRSRAIPEDITHMELVKEDDGFHGVSFNDVRKDYFACGAPTVDHTVMGDGAVEDGLRKRDFCSFAPTASMSRAMAY